MKGADMIMPFNGTSLGTNTAPPHLDKTVLLFMV